MRCVALLYGLIFVVVAPLAARANDAAPLVPLIGYPSPLIGYHEAGFTRIGDHIVIQRNVFMKSFDWERDLLNGGRFEAVASSHQEAGLAIVRIREDSLYRKLGLWNGDVVKSLNGKSVDHNFPQKLATDLEGSSQIEIQCLRLKEKPFKVTIVVK